MNKLTSVGCRALVASAISLSGLLAADAVGDPGSPYTVGSVSQSEAVADADAKSAVRLVKAPAAAGRALCLGAVVMRGEFEMVVAQSPSAKPDIKRTVVDFHRQLGAQLNH